MPGPDLLLAALKFRLCAGQGSPGRIPLLQQQIHLLQHTIHFEGPPDLRAEPSQETL